MAVAVADIVAVGVAARAAGGKVEGEAVALPAQGEADAEAVAAALVGAGLAGGVLRGQEVDVVVGVEGEVVTGGQVAALDGEVTCLYCPLTPALSDGTTSHSTRRQSR